MECVVLAYHNIGCAGIEALIRNNFDIMAVFTHRDDPGENVWFQSVTQLAASNNIPVYAPGNINHPIWIQRIKDLKPDILFSFYYRDMIKPSILEIPPAGCLNLHGSYLPAYRGRCPVNWVLVNGEKETGVTLHYMTPKPDDGDIVAQEKILIEENDTAKSLHEKLTMTASEMLDNILPLIKNNSAPRIPQDHSKSTYFGGRKPADGEIDWSKSAREIRNLVRAVTIPYPGAFSYVGDRKCLFWTVSEISSTELTETKKSSKCGAIISTDPLIIQCGKGALQVEYGQQENGVYMRGIQLAQELNLTEGMMVGPCVSRQMESAKKKSVLILGVNGFIGNALSERLLESGKYIVHGMDLRSDYIDHLLNRPDFYFDEGDISIHREWIEYHVRKCDVVIPLVAIATPIEYTRNPLEVFELDFEENLRIIRYCVKYKKRIIFPSTSEVYGMCEEEYFDEDNSKLVLGPICKQRWIYSCIKQLLDRVIWAYGEKEDLCFTLFRPFNWIGPKLDSLTSARIGSSRAITQLILNLVEGTPIQLIDGGEQKRCFTDVREGVECLYRIIENKDGICDGKIINIGNPENEASIKQLGEILVEKFKQHPLRSQFPPFAGFRETESAIYYGKKGMRMSSIENLVFVTPAGSWGGTPNISLEQSVEQTLDFFLRAALK